MEIAEAATELKNEAEDFPQTELGVMHFVPRDGTEGDEFLLIGLNESNAEAVEVFTEWKQNWLDEINYVGADEDAPVPPELAELAEETNDTAPETITIHEFTQQ